MACKRKSTAIDNLVELAPLDILEAAVKKKRKLMGIGAPAPVKQMRIPVQTHGYWDIKRIEIGLTDRQTLKSAKFDRLLYGHKNVINHRSPMGSTFLIFQKNKLFSLSAMF